MNVVILIGCISTKPIVEKIGEQFICRFNIATIESDEFNYSEPSYIKCVAYGELGYQIFTHYTQGTPLAIRGRLIYDSKAHENSVRVMWSMHLQTNDTKQVHMGIDDFLEIYDTKNVLRRIRELQNEQIRLEDKKNDSANNVGENK